MSPLRKIIQEQRTELKTKLNKTFHAIRKVLNIEGNLTAPKTDLANIKFSAKTVSEEGDILREPLAAEIAAWNEMLPDLINDFERIKDPRKPKKIKHSITVILIYALLLFLFRLPSRKEINLSLARPKFFENIQTLIPEIDSSPHSDTVARVLERIEPEEIQEAHIKMLKKLIKNKKFIRLLIDGELPISIDGVEKIKRKGALHAAQWLERHIGSKDNKEIQQYVYIVEANITFGNGLSIPLMSEFLYYDGNSDVTKQDCEILGFKRLAKKLKAYFKRQKIIVCLDKLYPCEPVLSQVMGYNWSYMIVLPSNKFKTINESLNQAKKNQIPIPGQLMFNGREQQYAWANGLQHKSITGINAISCVEKYTDVDKETGEEIILYSEHKWITNLKITPSKLHLLCNLCARKRWGIEDSNNTEKNRGYSYKHAFSYNWNAMVCFHYMMRLAHAINVLAEYTPKLKAFIKKNGWSRTLNWVKEVMWSPWVNVQWLQNEKLKNPIFKIE